MSNFFEMIAAGFESIVAGFESIFSGYNPYDDEIEKIINRRIKRWKR